MNPILIGVLIAGFLGAGAGAAVEHRIDAGTLAKAQAQYQAEIASINATSAKQLADALTKQQAAEGQISALQTQYTNEVNSHASDSLKYRAALAVGTQRVRVHVASCGPSAAPSQGATAAAGTDAAASYGYLDGTTASSVFKVAADDQAEIDKLTALQAYVKALQDQGYIGK